MTTKSTILWIVILCSSVELHRYFGRTYCLHLQSLRVSLARDQQQAGSKIGEPRKWTRFCWLPQETRVVLPSSHVGLMTRLWRKASLVSSHSAPLLWREERSDYQLNAKCRACATKEMKAGPYLRTASPLTAFIMMDIGSSCTFANFRLFMIFCVVLVMSFHMAVSAAFAGRRLRTCGRWFQGPWRTQVWGRLRNVGGLVPNYTAFQPRGSS